MLQTSKSVKAKNRIYASGFSCNFNQNTSSNNWIPEQEKKLYPCCKLKWESIRKIWPKQLEISNSMDDNHCFDQFPGSFHRVSGFHRSTAFVNSLKSKIDNLLSSFLYSVLNLSHKNSQCMPRIKIWHKTHLLKCVFFRKSARFSQRKTTLTLNKSFYCIILLEYPKCLWQGFLLLIHCFLKKGWQVVIGRWYKTCRKI